MIPKVIVDQLMINKQWYTIRYKFNSEDIWRYHKCNQAKFCLYSLGHAKRIIRDRYQNFEHEIVIVELIGQKYNG